MKSYLALTLGPVYKTIKQARSTREIWATSYIFSAVMREIIYAADNMGHLISPYKLDRSEHRFGSGIYPDRAFWLLTNDTSHEQLEKVIHDALKSIQDLTDISADEFGRYLRTCAVTISTAEGDIKSAVLRLNQLLDNLELQEKISNPRIDLITELTDNIQKLYKDGHQNHSRSIFIHYDWNGKPQKRLPSIMEIATRDLKYGTSKSGNSYDSFVTNLITDNLKDLIISGTRKEHNKAEAEVQEAVLKTLKKEYVEQFRFRHKYIAFVKADGDNMGNALAKIGNNDDSIRKFSEFLSGFAALASELIYHYGGVPVFSGGDDLLFALPLTNSNPETIDTSGKNTFELISKLDRAFPAAKIAALTDNTVTPSLSYGISFSYYKYPMDETIETSDESLYKAKDFPGKNAVSFKVRKHSGQSYGACFEKDDAFRCWFSLVNDFMEFNDDAFLASFMYKIVHLEQLIIDALCNAALENFFKNQFNEKNHGTIYDKYLKAVREFLQLMFESQKVKFSDPIFSQADIIKSFKAGNFSSVEIDFLFTENASSNPVKLAAHYASRQLYACLRFIQFLNQKDNEQNN